MISKQELNSEQKKSTQISDSSLDEVSKDLTSSVYHSKDILIRNAIDAEWLYWAEFRHDIAPVRKRFGNGSWVYINKKGEIITPENEWDEARAFSDDLLAVVCKDSKFGYVNISGEIIVPLDYEDAKYASNGLIIVKKDGKWGFIDVNGKNVIDCKYFSVDDFSNGLASVMKDYTCQFINTLGQTISENSWEQTKDFHNDRAIVMDVKTKKWGVIDKFGEYVIPAEYQTINNTLDILFCAQKELGGWYILDLDGVVCDIDGIVRTEITQIEFFYNGMCPYLKGSYWGFLSLEPRNKN